MTPSAPTSRSSQPLGNGWAVTVKLTGLLTFMLGATVTASAPEVAPWGMVASIVVLLQGLMVSGAPLSSTMLPFWLAPKLAPVIVSGLPIAPVEAETELMLGAGRAAEVMETLSKVAVASEVEPLFTARPIK